MKLLITVVSGFIYLIGLIIYAVHLNLLWDWQKRVIIFLFLLFSFIILIS